ncbi:MAG: hypothetical protein K2K90_04105 [Lachnospiraceae bacterium]|nr:hypothetical protein [Lachnospiraceae bacterium]
MKVLKRILCMLLCVVILSGTVGTRYFDANHMERVDAAAEAVAVGLSAAALYAICFYVGTVAYAHAPIETASLSDDQIASMGYSTISYMTASNLLGIPSAPNAPLIGFIDKAGQSYVFGSEALKAVAETSFQVIQGGKKPDDDDDDDDEEGGIIDNLIRFPGNAKSLSGVCTAAFAGILGSVIKDQYDKFMNGEESVYSAPEVLQTVTDADIAAQWSGEPFGYSSHVRFDYSFKNSGDKYYHYASYVYNLSNTYAAPVCGYVRYDNAPEELSFWSLSLNGYGRPEDYTMNYDSTCITTYKGEQVVNTYTGLSGYYVSNLSTPTLSFSANFPVFSSRADAENYLKGLSDATSALNYAKTYRIADWLADDWAGVLLDPLTGLVALGDWANIARHQGLSALGNELDLASFLNYLRDFFANLGQNPLPDVDPGKAPVLYPSGDADNALDPDTDIDPVRDPVISPDPSVRPVPKPDPKPDPDPDPGTDPDPDPDPGVTPLPDMDAADYRVELSGIFPFCIPFDFVALLKTLDAEPRAPCFTFPVVIPALDYREDVKLDLAIFDDVAKVIRLCEKVSFILFLMFVTSKVIRW